MEAIFTCKEMWELVTGKALDGETGALVRSATLDTWLPEQVSFIQGMGNAKANAYWEAELPPNFKRPTENDRVGLENFVRAKWVPRNSRSPLRTREEKSFPADKQKAITDIKDHRDHDTSEKLGNNVGEETRALHGGKETEHYDTRNAKDRERSRGTHGRSDQAESSRSSRSPVRHQSTSSTSITMPSEPPGKSHQLDNVIDLVIPSGSNQFVSTIKEETDIPVLSLLAADLEKAIRAAINSKPDNPLPYMVPSNVAAVPIIAAPKHPSQTLQSVSVASTQKGDPATDLFNLLTIEDPAQNSNGASPPQVDDNSWAAFQSADAMEPSEKNFATEPSAAKNDVMAGLEDLFKASPPPTEKSAQPQLSDAKNNIMSLFEKSTMVSPYALHQQQMAAFLAQQQSLMMAATTTSSRQVALQSQQQQQHLPLNRNGTVPSLNSFGGTPGQGWPNVSFLYPGVTSSVGAQNVLHQSSQGEGFLQTNPMGSQVSIGASSLYNKAMPNITMPYNSLESSMSGPSSSAVGQVNSRSTAASSEASSSSSGADYDFSSLMAGVFSKQ